MSYAIGYIIYGIPWTERLQRFVDEKLESETQDEWYEDPEGYGFTTVYSGSANLAPSWCGVILSEISECNRYRLDLPEPGSSQKPNSRNIRPRLVPTDDEKALAQEKIDRLPPEMKNYLDEVGVYIIWGTS